MTKPFIIYRSSAGSGKTYTLAKEYVQLALQNPNAYRSILAVTFTNKATREMKDRVLSFLYELSRGANADLSVQLSNSLNISQVEVQKKAKLTLSHMLHGYSWFSIMTIDAFFQKVIRAFARELNLQAGFALELDQNKVLDEVVDQLLSEISQPTHSHLKQWMIRFAEEKVENGKIWDFRRDVKQLATELFKEDYKIRQDEVAIAKNDFQDSRKKYAHTLKSLKAIVAKFENVMQSFGEKGLSHMQKYELDYTDFAYGKNGVAYYFVRMVEGVDLEPKKRATEAADNPEKWSTKKSAKKDQISEAVNSGLMSILQQAIAYYNKEIANYESARQLLKFIYAYGILQDISDKLSRYKQENDLMLISDAALFLRDIIGKDDTPFVYEKIGSSYRHFLIDEFQDTSGLQWANFRPLVENSLDSSYRNLVVGDVKQSIYRWRGGDWQLLLEKIESDIAYWYTQVKQLTTNFRSLPDVIQFNNELFAELPSLIFKEVADQLEQIKDSRQRETLLKRASIIQSAYREASQSVPAEKNSSVRKGYIQIELLDREKNDQNEEPLHWKDQVKNRLPALVEHLQDQGYQLKDIAFLVRNKRDGKEIVDTLIQYQNDGHARAGYRYDLISSESMFLQSSLSVGLLIDLMRLLENPDHCLARASILYKYQKLQGDKDLADDLDSMFAKAANNDELEGPLFFDDLPHEFKTSIPILSKLPLYEMVESLLRIFQLDRSPELAYVQAFQDVILEYSGQQTGDLHTFLRWWDETGKESSVQIADTTDAMRILTIHKAKGLQFKVVMIPFCDWELDHRSTQDHVIWTEAQQPPFNTFGLMPMRYSSKLANTVFYQDYFEEMIRAHIDNLNLLYVAFTRAEECLYAMAAPYSNKKGECKVNTIANALHHLCGVGDKVPMISGRWDEENRVFTSGKPKPTHLSISGSIPPSGLMRYPSFNWRDKISIRPVAKNFFQFNDGGTIQVNKAIVKRDVLASLSCDSELRQAMEKVYFEKGLSRQDCEAIYHELKHSLQHEPLRNWFHPEVSSQCGINLIKAGGQEFTLHRLVTTGEKATLIHFSESQKDKRCWQLLKDAHEVLKSLGFQLNTYLFDTSVMEAILLPSTEAGEFQFELDL